MKTFANYGSMGMAVIRLKLPSAVSGAGRAVM